MKKERKIIIEAISGSKLYGTEHAESDDDFYGVFLPSTEDIFSLHQCPRQVDLSIKISKGPKNEKGDIDRKFDMLSNYLLGLSQGQSKNIELLFSPKKSWISHTDEWLEITSNRELFISQNSLTPFLGFALSQVILYGRYRIF